MPDDAPAALAAMPRLTIGGELDALRPCLTAATADGVAAAPSPATTPSAQQRDPNVGDVTGYPPTIVYQPGTEGRTALAESSTEGFREIHPDRSAPAPGPQRKEPTP